MAVSIDSTSTRADRSLALLVSDLARRVDATERNANRTVAQAARLSDDPAFVDLVRRVEAIEAALGGSP
jgi:hypothetical protein